MAEVLPSMIMLLYFSLALVLTGNRTTSTRFDFVLVLLPAWRGGKGSSFYPVPVLRKLDLLVELATERFVFLANDWLERDMELR